MPNPVKKTRRIAAGIGAGIENQGPNHTAASSSRRLGRKKDDSDEDSETPFRRDKKRQKKNCNKHMSTQIEPLKTPSLAEKKQIISQISSGEFDRNLQIVLWEIDCNYVLLPHQFLGVRALAGVPNSFPGPMKLKSKELSLDSNDSLIFDWVVKTLCKSKPRREDDRGILMADVMGLGKTVQAVVACMLRNAIAEAKNKGKKPTLIVSPNDAVLTQWLETLVRAGVDQKDIYRFVPKDPTKTVQGTSSFLLCNRYDLQTDLRFLFKETKPSQACPKSTLYPRAPKKLLLALKNQYLAAQGKAKNEEVEKGDRVSASQIVSDLLGEYMDSIKRDCVFRTVVFDEAHFMKSLLTFWGMASCLIGLHSLRTIPLSGTPFNNSTQDMATLMTMIDPTLDSASENWWKNATSGSAARSVTDSISEWSTNFLIRRDKSVIEKNLPTKTVYKKAVAPYPLELTVYEHYEEKFLKILQNFQRLSEIALNVIQIQRLKQMTELMMALATCMRSALIHPLLPGGGRCLTVLFSPTRNRMQSVLRAQEDCSRCVCCSRKEKLKVKSRERNADAKENLNDSTVNDEDGNDDEFFVDDEEKVENDKRGFANTNKGTGEIVPIPGGICQLSEHGIRHFSCESCLVGLQEDGKSCPLCSVLLERLRCDSGRNALIKKKHEAKGQSKVQVETEPEDMDLPRPIYCESVFGGFRASAKLQSIIDDYRTKIIPTDDKVLVVSFFKGSLDLLEAMFHEINAETARFDGDIDSEEREDELERFKNRDSCKILLMTVQTGGTGLNLVEANHVWFVDRFWNPMVMEQAEDRCFRLGQTKNVFVTYHDVSGTVDDVMRYINEVKANNATIILADGSKLSASTAGLSFKDISGCLGNAVRAVKMARMNHVMKNQQNIILPLPPSEVDFQELDHLGMMPQFSSLIDAIASMLGYELPPSIPPAPSLAKMKTKDTHKHEEKKVMVPKTIGSSVIPSPTKSPESVKDMEDAKPASAKPAAKSQSSKISAFHDLSDDDSIPDAVVFSSKK